MLNTTLYSYDNDRSEVVIQISNYSTTFQYQHGKYMLTVFLERICDSIRR